jgi:uncharacterized membrane protein
MNRVGAIALILGLAFFFKYAMDNNWITQSMRVAVGVVAGAALLAGARYTHRRDLPIFAQGLVGAGLGALYLSVYASANFYHLIPQPVALGALALVVGLGFVQALMYDSLAVALLAWAGGFAAVPLLGISQGSDIGAIGYLLLLDAGILAVVVRRDGWAVLEPLAMGASYVTFFGWYLASYDASKLTLATIAISLFWVMFYAMDVWRIVTERGSRAMLHHALGSANVLLYYAGLVVLLLHHAVTLGLMTVALGALYISTILVAKHGLRADDRLDARYTVTAIVLGIVATPALASGFLLPILWSVEALALLACGIRWKLWYIWWPSIGVYALASSALLAMRGALSYEPLNRFVPLVNQRALAFLVLAAALVAGIRVLRRLEHKSAPGFVTAFQYAWQATIFLLLTVETVDLFGRLLLTAHGLDRLALEQQRLLALSLVWMLFALPLVYAGLRTRVFPWLSTGLAAAALSIGIGAGTGLAYQPIERFVPLVNDRAAVMLLLIAGLVILGEWLRRQRDEAPWIETALSGYRTVIVFLGFELLTAEIHDYFRHASGSISESAGPSGTFVEIVILAAIWVLYSFPLVRYGIRNRSLAILLTGLGSLGAGTGAGAIAAAVYQPATWLSTALTLRPIILLFIAVALLLQMRWLREAQRIFTWLDTVILALQAGTVLLGFELITAQTRDVYDHQATTVATSDAIDRVRNLEQLTMSVLWLAYAIVLLIVGFWRRLRWLRLASLALLGFTLLKIVAYDLSFLSPAFRSLSFIGLGIVLLAASYLYQRYRSLLLEGV